MNTSAAHYLLAQVRRVTAHTRGRRAKPRGKVLGSPLPSVPTDGLPHEIDRSGTSVAQDRPSYNAPNTCGSFAILRSMGDVWAAG